MARQEDWASAASFFQGAGVGMEWVVRVEVLVLDVAFREWVTPQ